MAKTYEDLLKNILALPEERMKDNVVIFDGNSGEFLKVNHIIVSDSSDNGVLDKGHLVLFIN